VSDLLALDRAHVWHPYGPMPGRSDPYTSSVRAYSLYAPGSENVSGTRRSESGKKSNFRERTATTRKGLPSAMIVWPRIPLFLPELIRPEFLK